MWSGKQMPSPAPIISVLALMAAVAVPAIASTGGSHGPSAHAAKKRRKPACIASVGLCPALRIAIDREVARLAPRLNVGRARTADSATSAVSANTANSADAANSANTANTANAAATLTPGQGFTALPLTTGWKNNAFTAPVGFYKDREGFVHLRGAVDKTSGGNPIATLPAGDRPGPGNDFFAVARDGGLVGELQVTAGGDLNDISAGGPTFISFEGVTFFAGS